MDDDPKIFEEMAQALNTLRSLFEKMPKCQAWLPPPQPERLILAIGNLYRIFASYALGPEIQTDGIPITSGPLFKPLKEITASELEYYYWRALTSYGGVPEFKHFLPRLCELYAIGDSSGGLGNQASLGGKLQYGAWTLWPAHEQDAVREFLHAWWAYVLDAPVLDEPYQYVAEDCLCCIGNAEDDLTEFLEAWISGESQNRFWHLVRYVLNQPAELAKGQLANPYWEERSAQVLQIVTWIRSPKVVEFLLAVADACDESSRNAILQAVDFLLVARKAADREGR